MKKNTTAALIFIFVIGLLGCEKNLSSGGVVDFSSEDFKADVRVFSDYYPAYPLYMTDLNPQNMTVPRELLVPRLVFGQLENEVIHTDRTKADVPVPVDMYVTAYASSSKYVDFYFETPVLGGQNTLTNTSTALSWILKWSFGANKIKISKNQFEDLLTKVEIVCGGCKSKSNSELVTFILGNTSLSTFVLDAVKLSNPTVPAILAQSSLNYLPPTSILATSSPVIGKNWQISQVASEPTTFNGVNHQTVLDIVLVDPTVSTKKIRPDSWTHSVRYDDDLNTTVPLSDVADTPLIYDIMINSAGVHTFNSIFNTLVSPPPITAKLTVSNQNLSPDCYATPPRIAYRASKRVTLNLDNTIIPDTYDQANVLMTRLSTSEIGVASSGQLPTQANAAGYNITFAVGATTRYTITKTVIATGITTIVTPSTKYQSGESIYFDGYDIMISGTPLNGDKVVFRSPLLAQSLLANGTPDNAANTNYRVAGVGCFDPDISRNQNVQFQLVSGPAGLIMSSSGLIVWSPHAADYPAATTDVNVVYNIVDTFGATQQNQLPLRVLKDNVPVFCSQDQLITDATSPTGRCPVPATLTTLPTAGISISSYNDAGTWRYREGAQVNEPLYFMDADGDPITASVTISAGTVQDSGNSTFSPLAPTNIFTNAPTNITVPDPMNAANTLNASIYNTTWQFRPSPTQVETIANDTVTFKFSIRYNTNLDPSLDGAFYQDYLVVTKIGNTRGSPLAVPSTAMCGATPCKVATNTNGDTRTYLIPQYKLYPQSQVGASTTQAGSITTALGGSFEVVPDQNKNMLLEGTTATIEVPVVGTARNLLTSQVVYQVTVLNPPSGLKQCTTFLKPGYTKVEEVICEGSNSATPDCLRLSFNYDPYTGVQNPIPYYMPPYCHLAITAMDSTDSSSKQSIFGSDTGNPDNTLFTRPLTLYFKNVNQAPQLLGSLPTEFTDGGGNYPSETVPFDMRTVLNKLFYDPDLGANNINVGNPAAVNTPDTVFTSNLIIPGVETTSHVIATSRTDYYKPEMSFEAPSSDRGANRKFTFQTSSDGVSWAPVSSTNYVGGPFSGIFLEVTTSATFNGTVTFQHSIDGGITWSATNATRIDTFPATSTASSTTHVNSTRRYLWSPAGNSQLFRVQLTALTAGSASVSAHSNYNVSGSSSSLATPTLILMSLRATQSIAGVAPVTLPTAQIPSIYRRVAQTDPMLRYGSRFLVNLGASDNYIRVLYETTAGVFTTNPQQEMSPDITVVKDFNVDPREVTTAIDCYMQNTVTMAAPFKCSSASNMNAYNKKIIDIPDFGISPINRNTITPINMIPSLTSAVDGNLAASGQRNSQYSLILRFRDNETPEQAGAYTNNYCTGKSCVETTVAVPVIEKVTKPTVKVLFTKQGQSMLSPNPFNLDDSTSIPTYAITNSQNFFEGDTVKVSVKVNPFNDLGFLNYTLPHVAGKHAYNISIRECRYMGKICPNSGRGIFSTPADTAPASDTDRDGDLTTDSDNGNPGEGNFVFYFKPKAGDSNFDDGGTTGTPGEYIYTFDIKPTNGGGNGNSTFTVKFQVKKI